MPDYKLIGHDFTPPDLTEIEEQIERTYKNIVQGPGFRDVMVKTNAWNWAIDECNILAMDIGDREVRVKLSYLASGENAEKAGKSFERDKIRGEAAAIVNDDGDVRYEGVTGELVMESDAERDAPPNRLSAPSQFPFPRSHHPLELLSLSSGPPLPIFRRQKGALLFPPKTEPQTQVP